MLTRSTYSTGLWIVATQAQSRSPRGASKPSLQSVAAGTKSQMNFAFSVIFFYWVFISLSV